jgi:hypothetical protein
MLELNKNHVTCPDSYNHIHYFELMDETTMKFTVGGGASVIFAGSCKYSIEKIEQTRQSNILFTHEISLSNFEFEENTSYSKHIQNTELLTKKIRFFEEIGSFFFVDCGDIYNDPNEEDELPCIKFDSRIVFESDPLFLFDNQYQFNAYTKMNYLPFFQKRLPDNYYYIECTGKYKLGELKKLGIKWIRY